MKIRQGFVSNSSSASFTVWWGIDSEEDMTVEDAVKGVIEWVDLTVPFPKDSKNKFVSHFWTGMMNSPSDFYGAIDLLFNIHCRENHYTEIGGGVKPFLIKTDLKSDQ
jgi:hypothetical protein